MGICHFKEFLWKVRFYNFGQVRLVLWFQPLRLINLLDRTRPVIVRTKLADRPVMTEISVIKITGSLNANGRTLAAPYLNFADTGCG
jgi:hypothetical protein